MTNPQITVDGKSELALVRDGYGFHSELSCPSPGQHSIAIEVTDPKRDTSPRIVFPVYCGVAPTKIDVRAGREPRGQSGADPGAPGRHPRPRTRRGKPARASSNPLLELATATLVEDRAKGIASPIESYLQRAQS